MWDRGNFGQAIVNHSALHDPWSQAGKPNTPFDQDFYLILNVAVGGTNGYFGYAQLPHASFSRNILLTYVFTVTEFLPSHGATQV